MNGRQVAQKIETAAPIMGAAALEFSNAARLSGRRHPPMARPAD